MAVDLSWPLLLLGALTGLVSTKLEGTNKLEELAATSVIEGGSIYASSKHHIYGNNVTLRSDHLPRAGQHTWIDRLIVLPPGPLIKYYVYVHPSGVTGSQQIRLQIWRPTAATEEKQFELIWQRAASVKMDYPVGALYSFDISGEDSIYIQSGDTLGWTNEGEACPITWDNTKVARAYFRQVQNRSFPTVGSSYLFDSLAFPYAFSVAVEIGTEATQAVVTGVSPLYGPVAGGTRVVITGMFTLIPQTVMLGETNPLPCEIIESTTSYLVVMTPPLQSTENTVPLEFIISFPGGTTTKSGLQFTYRPNPKILDIYPLKSIPGGGTTLTAEGTSMNAVANPVLQATLVTTNKQLTNTSDTVYQEVCWSVSSTQILCPTPALSQAAQASLAPPSQSDTHLGAALYIGFLLDGVDAYKNISAHETLADKGSITLYASPEFPQEIQVFTFKKETVLIIKGSGLSRGVTLSDYTVYIGSEVCQIVELSDDSIHCLPPQQPPLQQDTQTSSKQHDVMVHIGKNTVHHVGVLKYHKLPLALLTALPVVLGVILIFIILAIILCRRSKKDKTTNKDLQIDAPKPSNNYHYGTTPQNIELPPVSVEWQ